MLAKFHHTTRPLWLIVWISHNLPHDFQSFFSSYITTYNSHGDRGQAPEMGGALGSFNFFIQHVLHPPGVTLQTSKRKCRSVSIPCGECVTSIRVVLQPIARPSLNGSQWQPTPPAGSTPLPHGAASSPHQHHLLYIPLALGPEKSGSPSPHTTAFLQP